MLRVHPGNTAAEDEKLNAYGKEKSETELTASVLKKDPKHARD